MTVPVSRLFPVRADEWQPSSDDHYTPLWVFDAMGLQFDLDVAAPPGGVSWIPADSHYSVVEDGLEQPWEGLIWCNPPFSNVAPWARRWCEHPDGVLLACVSKASWPSKVFAAADVVWFPRRAHMNFVAPEDSPEKHIPFLVFVAGRGLGAAGVRRLAELGGCLMRAEERVS